MRSWVVLCSPQCPMVHVTNLGDGEETLPSSSWPHDAGQVHTSSQFLPGNSTILQLLHMKWYQIKIQLKECHSANLPLCKNLDVTCAKLFTLHARLFPLRFLSWNHQSYWVKSTHIILVLLEASTHSFSIGSVRIIWSEYHVRTTRMQENIVCFGQKCLKLAWQTLNLSPSLAFWLPIGWPHHWLFSIPLKRLLRSACLLLISRKSLRSMHNVLEGLNGSPEKSRFVREPSDLSWPEKFLPDFEGISPCNHQPFDLYSVQRRNDGVSVFPFELVWQNDSLFCIWSYAFKLWMTKAHRQLKTVIDQGYVVEPSKNVRILLRPSSSI